MKICGKCGTIQPNADRFCIKCGARFNEAQTGNSAQQEIRAAKPTKEESAKESRRLIRKLVAFFFGTFLIVFGIYGFFQYHIADAVTDIHSPVPLNDVAGMVADSKGNIYIGDIESGSIQVFNGSGKFLYGYKLPTEQGQFRFGIDAKDVIHTILYKTNTYYQFSKNQMIDSESVDENDETWLAVEYNMPENDSPVQSFTANGKTYALTLFHRFSVRNSRSGAEQSFRSTRRTGHCRDFPVFCSAQSEWGCGSIVSDTRYYRKGLLWLKI